jgi:hypothetical protein
MRRSAIGLGLAAVLVAVLAVAVLHAQQRGDERDNHRRVYEGVVGLKKRTIGTLVLLDTSGDSLRGWMRLEKFVPIEGGTVLDRGVEFRAAGNTYQIDERRGRISYSGPDGEGSRYVQRLQRQSGRLEELSEDRNFGGGKVAMVEVAGRVRNFRVGRPTLWKHSEAPFETFERIEELLGKEIALWLGESDGRTGRVVGIEEPGDMNIPLKKPKEEKPKEDKKEEKKD